MIFIKSLNLRNVFSFLALWVGVNLILVNSFSLGSIDPEISYGWLQKLGVILFGSGAFVLFKNWAEKNKKAEVYGNFKLIIVPMTICIMAVTLDFLYVFNVFHFPEIWLSFYYFIASFIVVIFLINQYFCYFNLIQLEVEKRLPVNVFNYFHWFLLGGFVFLFVPKEYEMWVYFPYLTVGVLVTLYIATQFSWVGLIKPRKKWYLAGMLFLVNLVNFFVFIHYSLRIDEYFFEVNYYPFAPFFLLLVFVCILSLVSFLSLLFYLPISGKFERKTNEMDRLLQIGNLGRDKSQDVELYQYLVKAAVEDTDSLRGWFNFKDQEESIVQAKNISISLIEKIESRLFHRLDPEFWKEKYFELTAESHPYLFDKELKNAHSLISFNYNIDYKEVGRLYLIKGNNNNFTKDHIHIIRSYLKQARLSYQSRLLVDQQVQAKRVEEEFKQAKSIQQKLLPNYNIVDDAVDFDAFLVPSRDLSGDFYDFFKLDENRMLIIMGDVAGKGLTASLYMAELKGIFQTLYTFDLDPKQYIYKINQVVNSCFESKVFVTLTYLLVNKKDKTFTYSRAGQCPLLYYQADSQEATFFEDEGMGLGILKDQLFEDKIKIYKHQYKSGDILLLFSDGISEARNEFEEQFGLEGIKHAVEDSDKDSAKKVNQYINKKIREHTLKNPHQDDLTSLVIRFK